jgi:hypothetical protein
MNGLVGRVPVSKPLAQLCYELAYVLGLRFEPVSPDFESSALASGLSLLSAIAVITSLAVQSAYQNKN